MPDSLSQQTLIFLAVRKLGPLDRPFISNANYLQLHARRTRPEVGEEGDVLVRPLVFLLRDEVGFVSASLALFLLPFPLPPYQ